MVLKIITRIELACTENNGTKILSELLRMSSPMIYLEKHNQYFAAKISGLSLLEVCLQLGFALVWDHKVAATISTN